MCTRKFLHESSPSGMTRTTEERACGSFFLQEGLKIIKGLVEVAVVVVPVEPTTSS